MLHQEQTWPVSTSASADVREVGWDFIGHRFELSHLPVFRVWFKYPPFLRCKVNLMVYLQFDGISPCSREIVKMRKTLKYLRGYGDEK